MNENIGELNSLRLERVRAQQNIITVFCMICMVFVVGWSVYAAVSQPPKTSDPKPGDKTPAVARDIQDSKAQEQESQPESVPDSEPDSQAEQAGATVTDITMESDDTLSDAVFIGDSRTVGLMNSTDRPQADFLCAVGLNIDTVLTSEDISLGDGSTGSLSQALSRRSYGRVYISFGTNEMGWPYIDVFKEHYSAMVSAIMAMQPDAEIYLVSILPVTRSQDYKGESVNNENARTFTQAISEVAADLGVHYLDCTAAVADSEGYLPEEASSDGVHLNMEYCLRWQYYIMENS